MGSLISFAQGSHCKDLRDKVYGMQAILPTKWRVPVDLGLPVMDVYFAAVELWSKQPETHLGRMLDFVKICKRLAESMSLLTTTDTRSSLKEHLWDY
jgi:hypothetical protein